MSIIYDALKKIERSNNITSDVKLDKSSKRITRPETYLLYTLVIFFAFFIGNLFFGLLSSSKKSINKVTKPIEINNIANEESGLGIEETKQLVDRPIFLKSAEDLKDKLVLNGVFFSDDKGYALINNQIVREGDVIEEAIVKRIGLDEVELEFKGRTFSLKPP